MLGGDAEAIATRIAESFSEGSTRPEPSAPGASALAGPDRTIPPTELEVALLAPGHRRGAASGG